MPALIVSILRWGFTLSIIKRLSMSKIQNKRPTFWQRTWPLLQPCSGLRHPTFQKPHTWTTEQGQIVRFQIRKRTNSGSSQGKRYFNKIRERRQNSAAIIVDTHLWVEEDRTSTKETWTSSNSTLRCRGSPHPQPAKVNRIAHHIMKPKDSRPKYSTIASCWQTITGHGQRPVVDATIKAYATQARNRCSRWEVSTIPLYLTCTWTITRKNQLRHPRCTPGRS